MVDVDRIYSEFLQDFDNLPDDDEDPDIINLVLEQIEFCDMIILNKCDLLEPSQIAEVKAAIRAVQPEAEFLECIRGKGYIWFEDDPVHVQLTQTAGRNASVNEFSNWVAAFDEHDKQEVFDNYPEVLDEWDPTYGDRLNQIVFIGRGYDSETIKKRLPECIR